MSMEYHGVIPNISLSRVSVGEYNLAWKNIHNSDLDGMSLASFCQSRAAYHRYLMKSVDDMQ